MSWIRMTTRESPKSPAPYAVMWLADHREGMLESVIRELGSQLAFQTREARQGRIVQSAVMLETFPTTPLLLCCPFPVLTWPEPYPWTVTSPGGTPTSGLVYRVRRPDPASPVLLEPLLSGQTGRVGS